MITNNYLSALFGTSTHAPLRMVDYAGNVKYSFFYNNASQLRALSLWYCMDTVYLNQTIPNMTGGVIFGSGDEPATPNDYTMDYIQGLTTTVNKTFADDDNGASCTAVYTITNTNANDVTISEVGIFSKIQTRATADATGGANYGPYLLEHTVLDTPVTIPAGGIGQVTYTIRMNYPTA